MTYAEAISFPYTVDPTGKVVSTTNTSKIYIDRVLTLLSTNIGQRPITVNYGVDWSKALFEADGDAQTAIRQAINSAISQWLPEIKVISINIAYDQASGIENVDLAVKLPDNTVANISVNSAILNYDGTITR